MKSVKTLAKKKKKSFTSSFSQRKVPENDVWSAGEQFRFIDITHGFFCRYLKGVRRRGGQIFQDRAEHIKNKTSKSSILFSKHTVGVFNLHVFCVSDR